MPHKTSLKKLRRIQQSPKPNVLRSGLRRDLTKRMRAGILKRRRGFHP